MEKIRSESPDFLGEDIVDGVDNELDGLLADGPEAAAEESEPSMEVETSPSSGGTEAPGIRIDREREEQEEQ